jgi:hypothetical protein
VTKMIKRGAERVNMRTLVGLVRASIVLVLSVSYFAHVFRLPEDTVLKFGLGDWVDPYFINYLLEHWYHSVWGFTDPSSPPMYFPARGTLGYSHGLVLYAPFYLAVRPFLHPFQAYSLTLFLILVTGTLCLYLVFRRFIRLGFIESLLLSAFFISSRNVINGATGVWSQRASVFLIPPILLLVLISARMPEGRPRLILAWFSGLLSALLFTQDFYTAQLALLVSALLAAGALLLAGEFWRVALELWQAATSAIRDRDPAQSSRRPSPWWLIVACLSLVWAVVILVHPIARTTIGPWRFSANDPTRAFLVALLTGSWFLFPVVGPVARRSSVGKKLRELWVRERACILAFLLGCFIGCLVFLWVYLGAYRAHDAFPADQLSSSLTARNPSNWRSPLDFVRDLGAYNTLRPFKLVFLVGILAWAPWFRVDRKSRLYGVWLMLVSFVVLLVAVRFNDFSIWKTLFGRFPSFSVIRDPTRIITVYELAVVLLTALFVTQLPRKSLFRISIALLLLFLLVTEWNPEVFDFERPIGVYNHWVETPIDIDSSCESFFIKGASERYMSRSVNMWTLYGIDSMFVSLKYSIPTLNGYSAWWPDGWGLANPQLSGYSEAVAQWIARHNLHGVCELDIEERMMRPYSPARVRK